MGSSDSVGGRRTCISLWYLPREQDTLEIFVLCHNYEPPIDYEPSYYEDASSQPIWRDAIMEEY
jgi:hypothetical protein